MPFCHSPWTNIDINTQGEIAPCCKFRMHHYDQKFDVKVNTIDQYVNSAFLQNIKKDFEQNKWPLGCERCQIEEQNHIESKRQLDHQRWQEQYDQYDLNSNQFITASIAFGNTCNLKCITCNAYSSSRWQQEYREIYNIDIDHEKFYSDDWVQSFAQQSPNIIHIDIPGGEPFLSGVPQQHQLLQHYIESGKAQKISLHYTTNATIFPNQTWWKLWEHFKEIDLQLSIDGVGARYEYIRFPGNWDSVIANVSRYQSQQSKNLRLSVAHTVSAYNIYYLDEFVSWCYNQRLPRPWLGRVHNPAHMRPSVWPTDAKAVIVAKLNQSHHQDVQQWARLLENSDDSDHFEMFTQKLYQHDRYRNLHFQSVFPELKEFV